MRIPIEVQLAAEAVAEGEACAAGQGMAACGLAGATGLGRRLDLDGRLTEGGSFGGGRGQRKVDRLPPFPAIAARLQVQPKLVRALIPDHQGVWVAVAGDIDPDGTRNIPLDGLA